jgi:hypothetical protein
VASAPSRKEVSGGTVSTPWLAALMASVEVLHHFLFQFLAVTFSRFAWRDAPKAVWLS